MTNAPLRISHRGFSFPQFCLPTPKKRTQDRTWTRLSVELPAKPLTAYIPVRNAKNTQFCAPKTHQKETTMSKRFPFTKRGIEAIPSHDLESPSREAEYSEANLLV